ncbi:hypothetical protein [Mesorhizobium sp. M0816]|uniref:hypothetical protein n=1 Tax=Mesorhizobium sp. M0816 TaxID=2957006 RepID=UPI003339A76E
MTSDMASLRKESAVALGEIADPSSRDALMAHIGWQVRAGKSRAATVPATLVLDLLPRRSLAAKPQFADVGSSMAVLYAPEASNVDFA